jgi:peptidoglycan hydrolase CwlO-like protein
MESIITLVVSVFTGLVTFFVGLQKGKKETDGLTLQNIEKSVMIYQTIIDDLKDEVMSLNKKVDELQTKVDELLIENAELKKMLEQHKLQHQPKKRKTNAVTNTPN